MIEKKLYRIKELKIQKKFEIEMIKSKKPLVTKGMKNYGVEFHVCPGCLRFLGFKNFRPYKIGWLDSNKEIASDPSFLEKILLDFGVNGKIKKVSHGPVVTLNEFEPAAGVKVSKIINLSDDIARNTSSESARIATIPGSNTVGIELPNIDDFTIFERMSVFYNKY